MQAGSRHHWLTQGWACSKLLGGLLQKALQIWRHQLHNDWKAANGRLDDLHDIISNDYIGHGCGMSLNFLQNDDLTSVLSMQVSLCICGETRLLGDQGACHC